MIRTFSELSQSLKCERPLGCFVDTTVLFSFSYALDISNEDAEFALAPLNRAQIPIFTNVNVRSEFLEQHRRVLIAECLIDFYDDFGSLMPTPLALKLQSYKTSFRRKMAEDKSTKLDPNQIKLFRRLLKDCKSVGQDAWQLFCSKYLEGRLERLWSEITSVLNIEFLSLRQSDHSPYLERSPLWEAMVGIMERNGLASSDAMILNMFLCSKIPILLTADLEMAEVAEKESSGQKQIFVPDSLFSSIAHPPGKKTSPLRNGSFEYEAGLDFVANFRRELQTPTVEPRSAP